MKAPKKVAKGFTLIELLIVLAIIGILFTLVYQVVSGGSGNVSYSLTGAVETRCIDGFKFTKSMDGSAHQMFDEKGHGIKCQ